VEKELAQALGARRYRAAERLLHLRQREFEARYPKQRSWLAWSALGWSSVLSEAAGKVREAIDHTRARQRLPAYLPQARLTDYLALGLLHQRLGEEEHAVQALRQGIRYGLRNPDAMLLRLLEQLHRMNRLTRSRELVQALQLSAKAIAGRAWKPKPGESLADAIQHHVERDRQRTTRIRKRLGR